MKLIVVINGANLNLLGEREPEIYGRQTLDELNIMLRRRAGELGARILFFQSNHEGEIIDLLHEHRNDTAGYILNPGAYTHYSYSMRDAIDAIIPPVVEVHLSDISKREEFRRVSVVEPVAAKQISGKGAAGYIEALEFLVGL